MGEFLIIVVVLGVLGIGAWLVERPRRVSDLHGDDWVGEQGRRR